MTEVKQSKFPLLTNKDRVLSNKVKSTYDHLEITIKSACMQQGETQNQQIYLLCVMITKFNSEA